MTIRWGVSGTGGIAERFAQGLRLVDGADLAAVASRSPQRAAAFARTFGVERCYPSYEELAADPTVDVVYVATPHVRHEADTVLFLTAGKHVLCEKPFALNATQARRMVRVAAERGLFLMEAMWSRFLPSYRALGAVLAEGRIGEPLTVEGDFGFRMPRAPDHRLFDPALGGGALLDLGIYPVQLCSLVLGPPDGVAAQAVLGPTGVDEQVAAVLHHRAGSLGVVKAAIRTPLSCSARISGSEGSIELPPFMHCPTSLTVVDHNGTERLEAPFDGEGLRFELAEVGRCLRLGLTESPEMPLAETIEIAQTLDAIRAQVGLTYPDEAGAPRAPIPTLEETP